MVSEEYDYDDALGDLFYEISYTYTKEGNNKNNRKICWDFWRGLSQWTKEQAVYLLCGIEPHDADFEKMPDVIVKIQLKAFDDLKVEIAPPIVWLKCFNDIGMFELEYTSRELRTWYNEQLAEKELTGDLSQDDANWNHQAVNLESNETKTIIAAPVKLDTAPETTSELSEREKQHAVILEAISELNYKPFDIPRGGCKKIKSCCKEKHPELFPATTSFKNAWDAGHHLFRMKNHKRYARRGK